MVIFAPLLVIFTFQLQKIVDKRKNKNAPGLNAIPFVVYKMCPKVLPVLLQIMNRVWEERTVPTSWQRALVVLLAKSDVLDDPSEFRPIALLNAEGRLFFSIMNVRLSDYMRKNKYIDVSVQKGFMERLSGCIEHSETMHQALLDAHANGRDLCISWIDLANAYGSVRHSMILFTLEWYFVPSEFAEIVFMYYEGLVASVMVGNEQTVWFRFMIGVFQGCTLSTILFNTAFNTVFDNLAAVRSQYGYSFTEIAVQKLVLGYADDIGAMTGSTRHMQLVLDQIQEWLDWTRTMNAKPRKCRCAGLTQGIVVDPLLTIDSSIIQFIGGDAFKFLGRLLSFDGTEKAVTEKLEKSIADGVEKIDKLPLLGFQKMWIFDNLFMSMISWDLMIHSLSPSLITRHGTGLGAIQTRMFKKWCKYALRANRTVFYRSKKYYGLGMKEAGPYFKKLQLIRCHLLSTSEDPDVRAIYAGRQVVEANWKNYRGRYAGCVQKKWSPTAALPALIDEVTLYPHSTTRRAGTAQGTQGLGLLRSVMGKRDTKEARERADVMNLLSHLNDEERLNECRKSQYFCTWMKWDNIMDTDFDWRSAIMSQEDDLFRFKVAAIEDQAPTPTNLKVWKVTTVATCYLCQYKSCSLLHILCGCPTGLRQGRQTWRHDSILLALYRGIRTVVNRAKAEFKQGVKPTAVPPISFVSDSSTNPEGKATKFSVPSVQRKPRSVLSQSDDWQMQFDLTCQEEGQIKDRPFPPHIVATSQRPDAILWSDKLKMVVWVELTSPWEENMHKQHCAKCEKYNTLAQSIRLKGWQAIPLYVEVGARGYIHNKWSQMSNTLGLKPGENKALRKRCEEAALRCSYYIFKSRKTRDWHTRPPLDVSYIKK